MSRIISSCLDPLRGRGNALKIILFFWLNLKIFKYLNKSKRRENEHEIFFLDECVRFVDV